MEFPGINIQFPNFIITYLLLYKTKYRSFLIVFLSMFHDNMIKLVTEVFIVKQYRESARISDINEQYIKSRRSIGICDEENRHKILVYGENALPLINRFSVKKVDDKIATSFYTIFLKKKKFISEVLVLRLSIYRYLVITQEADKTMKLLKRARRKYPNTMISNSDNEYALFSFHGDNAEAFFKELDYRYLFKTTHQNYTYYQLLVPKKDEKTTIRHFTALNFVPISLETEKLFLYNNNVVLCIGNIPKKYRLSVCNALYPFENFTYKTRMIRIAKYELEGNYLVTNRHKVYNYLGKKTGIVHCTYRLPYKKFPFILAFVISDQAKQISMVRVNKNDALIKPILNF